MLQNQIQDEVKIAMRAKDKPRLGVLRLITAAIKQREIDERITLDDEQVLVVLDKMQKQRRDSLSQFEAAGRDELVAQEAFELDIIQTFLPTPLTDNEVMSLVASAIEETSATNMQDMGKVMGILKPKIQGRADAAQVSKLVKLKLTE